MKFLGFFTTAALFGAASAVNITFDGFDAQLTEKPLSRVGLTSHFSDVCYFAPYADIIGRDIGNTQSLQTNCCQLCLLNNKCHAYTWTNYNGGTCWFKSSVGGIKVNEDALSSHVGDSQIEIDVFNCDMPGNDIGTAASSSFEPCALACNKVSNCRAVTWTNYNGGTCWLKSRVSKCVRVAGASTYVFFR